MTLKAIFSVKTVHFHWKKENQQKEVEKSKTRVIKEGGGNKPKLSEEEQIILMLVYLRHYLSFQLLGIMFKISESSAHNIFNYWALRFSVWKVMLGIEASQ